MSDTHSRVGCVDALSSMPSGTIDINANVSILDLDFNLVVSFWQDDYFGCRSMDTSIGLSDGNTLDTMCATFVFHAAVRAFAFDDEGDILHAPLFGIIG